MWTSAWPLTQFNKGKVNQMEPYNTLSFMVTPTDDGTKILGRNKPIRVSIDQLWHDPQGRI